MPVKPSYSAVVAAITYSPQANIAPALAALQLQADAARLLRNVLSKPGY